MTELQKVQYEILCKVDEVCRKNHIKYYISGGTLLGAVRHQGFIPWDDDIDIDMPYEDYVKFLKVAQFDLGDGYFLLNPNTDKYDFRSFSRVTKRNTTFMDSAMVHYHGNREIFIDIFPIAHFIDEQDVTRKRKWLKISNLILEKDNLAAQKRSSYLAEIREHYGKLGLAFLSVLHSLPYHLRKKIHEYALDKVYDNGKIEGRPYWSGIWGQITDLYPSELLIGPETKLQFEDGSFPVIPGYKGYLEIHYGDYMKLPPEEERRHVDNYIVDFNKSYTEYIED